MKNAWTERIEKLEKENAGLRGVLKEIVSDISDLKLKKISEFRLKYPEYFNKKRR